MRWSETLGHQMPAALTIRRQIDIPQSGPGWEGTECNSINQTARVHHAARRRGGVAARGARAATRPRLR